MFQPTIKVQSKNSAARVMASMKKLTDSKVLVGIPAKTSTRKKPPINNAELTYIHTHGIRTVTAQRRMGAMMKNRNLNYKQALALYMHSKGSSLFAVPPRPIIEPAIEANKKVIEAELKLAAVAALAGDSAATERHLRLAGMTAQNVVRAWFTDPRNHWPPNAPSTIKRKGSDKPLIDTGQLRKAMTYVVEMG